MEDGKIHHSENTNNNNNNLNLHQLNLPSSSSSPSLLISPCDADALLGFFNHGAAINHPSDLISNLHHYSPIFNNTSNTSPSSSFMGAAEICPSSGHMDPPAHSLIINSNVGAGKRRKTMTTMNKGGSSELEKCRGEVIHVRAKRGQATDSHSLAERVRRERINEKLKVLQDLVPGCYKTMGMAVMLDVIINYVQSLQNQIEFLSMKLSAASMFYDFNSPEAEAMEALQRTTNPVEAREMERMMREQGFDPVLLPSSSSDPAPAISDHHHHLHSTWPF
ncbi:hypothetical protein V2J09_003610 [Rumex salicifolius]